MKPTPVPLKLTGVNITFNLDIPLVVEGNVTVNPPDNENVNPAPVKFCLITGFNKMVESSEYSILTCN